MSNVFPYLINLQSNNIKFPNKVTKRMTIDANSQIYSNNILFYIPNKLTLILLWSCDVNGKGIPGQHYIHESMRKQKPIKGYQFWGEETMRNQW